MTQALVVGAGPVGLFLASLLGSKGFSVLLLDKKTDRKSGSNAIGISPPSLALLKKLNLAEKLVRHGAPIREVFVHGPRRTLLGRVDFAKIGGDFPFMLSVPQAMTEQVLEDHVRSLPSVQYETDWEFVSLLQNQTTVEAHLRNSAGKTRSEKAEFLAGCDGPRSAVRDALGVSRTIRRYPATFLMGDYKDTTEWGNEAHLFFTPRGAVESFPLGNGQRRWIVQTRSFMENPGQYLENEVGLRTGLPIEASERTWQSPFGVQRWMAPRYDFGRVYLCGDSAHQMSPIGGQGMNTGFADAEFLAALLTARIEEQPSGLQTLDLGKAYSRYRRKAAKAAAGRAALSMAIGTVRGIGSTFRNLFLRFLLNGFLKPFVPPHYAMLTIPFRSLSEVQRRAKKRLPLLEEFL